ncbi:MAG: nitroreductase/quinone reductase family protein [Candidatus Binataceae bacterium]
MKIDPMTRVFSRWFSSMHVAFYRLVDGWSPLNWNTLVLTVRGRKTGREISKPLLYLERDGKLYVVASFGGSDKAPGWYLNLVANPEVTVERRWTRGAYRARTLAPEERQEMWPRLVAMYPGYADYQRRTSRTIQLVELAPV